MVEWITSKTLVPYEDAVRQMEARAADIRAGRADEAIWLLEHPALYTAGPQADPADLRMPDRFAVYPTRRGGQYTYHGPGQRVVYVMLDVGARGRDLRRYVQQLESWVIQTLARFNVVGEIRPGRVGVWVTRPDCAPLPNGAPREDKIAAIGIQMRKWISTHGISINVEPDLSHFEGIVPCGIHGHGVTSMVDLGYPITLAEVDEALRATFVAAFEPPSLRTQN